MRDASPPTEVGRTWPDGVRDEVRARQPGDGLVHAARGEQPLPAPGHRRHGDERQRRPRATTHGTLAEPRMCERLAEVDLRGGCRRRRAPRRAASATTRSGRFIRRERSWTRRSAATASRMSSSECAGESGSDSTSAPARSVTGSGGWCGGEPVAVRAQPVHRQEVDRGADVLVRQRALVLVAGRATASIRTT